MVTLLKLLQQMLQNFQSASNRFGTICINPVDTGRKLNVHKTFRRRPGLLLNVLCTFNLRPVSAGKGTVMQFKKALINDRLRVS